MTKKKVNILIAICAIFFFLGMAFIFKTNAEVKQSTSKKNQEPLLTEINTSEFEKMLANKKSGFVYFGRPSCPYCDDFKAKLAKSLLVNHQKAYYYNSDKARQNDEDFVALLKKANIKTVPTLVFYTRGLETARYKGNIDSEKKIKEWLQKKVQ